MRFWLKRAAEELVTLGHLIVVARRNGGLCDYFKRELAGEPITVVLDRRRAERRTAVEPHGEERRRADRRRAEHDDALEAQGFLVFPRPAVAAGQPPSG
jgi:hypothetical protein